MISLRSPSRRCVLLGGVFAGALGASVLQGPTVPETRVSGIVFEDISGNSTRGRGDPGIPGVLVSNGLEISRTDASGRYELPAREDSVIFIIKPAGWQTPLDPITNLPRFHIAPAPGDASGGFDFPLRRAEEHAKFDVLMFADPQPGDERELGFLRDSFASPVSGADAAFALTLGDLTADRSNLYERYNAVMGQIGLPIWNLPGNHDLDYEAADNRRARETWKRHFGPSYYAFEYAQTTFIMLDNVDWRGAGRGYAGRIGETQLAFVRNLLRETPRERLVVVCMHIPLASPGDAETPASNTADAAQLLALLGGRKAVSFAGHMHVSEHVYLSGVNGEVHLHQMLAAVSGSWWSGPLDHNGVALAECCDGAPNGHYILSIDGSDWQTRFAPTRERGSMRISVSAGADGAARQEKASVCSPCREILVNVFDGGPRTQVEVSISGGQANAMQRTGRRDPYIERLFAANSDSRQAWIEPEISSHIWTAGLPENLGAGFHRAEVRVVDELGREYKSSVVFEVA